MSILNHIPPGYTLRDVQIQALTDIEKNWETHDVFVLDIPVASGKSLVAYIIAKWQESKKIGTSILTPTVMLQEQYSKLFTDIPMLKGKSRYKCVGEGHGLDCEESYNMLGTYPDGCPYNTARLAAKKSTCAIYNFYGYMLHKAQRPNLIIDEAHNTVDVLSDFYEINLWKHIDHYPDSINTHGDVAVFLETRANALKVELDEAKSKGEKPTIITRLRSKIERFRYVIDGLMKAPTTFFIEHTMADFRGQKKKLMKIRPLSVAQLPHNLWPTSQVKKIILMSSTISDKDIKRLGLSRRRINYFSGDSPIPAANRSFMVTPIANMAFKYQKIAIPTMARHINELAEQHADEKGVIHIPYSLAIKFKKYLTSDRFLWHNKDTKEEVYNKFRKSDEPLILMASGMSEGVDFVNEAGRWQVITKIMYQSLADPLIKKQLADDAGWYNWQAVRTTIQQYGRICRTPKDTGVTYILDAGFKSFYNRTRAMWPDWFKQAILWE